MGTILFIIGALGLWSWFGARRRSILEGEWNYEKGPAQLWLILWIGLLVVGVII